MLGSRWSDLGKRKNFSEGMFLVVYIYMRQKKGKPCQNVRVSKNYKIEVSQKKMTEEFS